ncbi:MAG: helix-turn-helix domain-containing protein [Haloarculaceae archaeon]
MSARSFDCRLGRPATQVGRLVFGSRNHPPSFGWDDSELCALSSIAEFDGQNSSTALSNALEAEPEVELEILQQAGTDPDGSYLFMLASVPGVEALEEAMATDEILGDVDRYTRMGGHIRYRIQLTSAAESVSCGMWIGLGGEGIGATWSDGWWQIRIRSPEGETLGQCRDPCANYDVAFDLRRIYSDPVSEPPGHGLTPEQWEALTVAHEIGYFDVHPQASMADFGDEVDRASLAVSERLRRGHGALVEAGVK